MFMRESVVKMLDDKDREFARILRELGVQQNAATIIAYLASAETATSRDLEIGSDLRQPEVSVASKILRKSGWIDEGEIKRKGRGRPLKTYKLKASIDEIIKDLEKDIIQEATEINQSIQRLKEMSAS